MTSTLDRGFGAGWRVAVAPLLTDAPIIALTVAVVASIPSGALNGLAIAGGLALWGIAVWQAAEAGRAGGEAAVSSSDVWRGVLVNLLSPHPWLFWFTAGAPLLVSGWRRGPWFGVAFLAGFYLLLVGSKLVLAWVVARTRHRLSDAWRRRLVLLGSALLALGGALLIWQGAASRFG